MRFALAALALFAVTVPARADCDHFKWSVAKERAAFAASPSPPPATGGIVEAGRAYALSLAKDAALPVAPEHAPKPGGYAAAVATPKLAAGVYQVTVSAEAWIDVAQNGALLKSSDFSGQHDCAGVRKSVRFALTDGTATVEISGAASDRLFIWIAPAP